MMSHGIHIRIQRGRILSIHSADDGVMIESESGLRHFPGCFVYPGFVDAHAHVIGLGMKLLGLGLYDARSAEECVRRCSDTGANRGDWIVGMGWNQELWDVPLMPDRKLLDEQFPSTPVCLRRADGHALWLNSEALHRCTISEGKSDPPGGYYLRRADGSLSGVVVDAAMEGVLRVLPEYKRDQYIEFIRAALHACAAQGITEIHDMDVAPHHVELFREMAEKGDLACRIQSYVSAQNNEWAEFGLLPAVGEFQQTVGVKFYADGALGSRGAALFDDYSDDPGNCGLRLLSEEQLYRQAAMAIEQGFHVATHAIGDAANSLVLNVYERLRKEGVANEQTILRIEHAQILRPQDRARFAASDIVASVQPVHCVSDAPMALKRLGDRCTSEGYPWHSLLKQNALMCAGSDFPIESSSVLLGLDAFCRRIPFGSSHPWNSHECIDRSSAIAAYTVNAHKAADMAYRRGAIRSGFDADLVIVDNDLETCADSELASTTIVATYCGAKLTYEA